jgi:hypothetical protein
MAGGVGTVKRQMNTFRGVKKDMLQRRTTLYLQSMTVSVANKNKAIAIKVRGGL